MGATLIREEGWFKVVSADGRILKEKPDLFRKQSVCSECLGTGKAMVLEVYHVWGDAPWDEYREVPCGCQKKIGEMHNVI